jgi:hypothetical protein
MTPEELAAVANNALDLSIIQIRDKQLKANINEK